MLQNDKYPFLSSNTNEAIAHLKAIFQENYPALCFFATKIVQETCIAEDIVEEVFIKLWQKQSDFSRYPNIKATLYRSVRNACLDYLRIQQRQKAHIQNFSFTIRQQSEPFALLEIVRSELYREILEALQELPEQCRTVVYLAYIRGWNNRKIATLMNIHISTVKTQKQRGILALRRKIIVPFLLPLLHSIA